MILLQRLYYRDACGLDTPYGLLNGEPLPLGQRERVCLEQGDTLDLSTGFNLFPASWWQAYTPITEVSITVPYSGRLHLQVLSYNTPGESVTLYDAEIESPSDTQAEHTFNVVVNETTAQGSWGLVLRAVQGSCQVGVCRISCPDAPCCTGRLGVVINTFQKEEFVHANVLRIDADADLKADRYNFLIIDNASTYVPVETTRHNFTLHQNANFGSSGGFTRGMIEAQTDEDTSHILIMDDDIFLDPECLLRMGAVKAYLQEPCAIGMALWSIDEPTKQFEQGALYSHTTLNERNCFNVLSQGGIDNLLEAPEQTFPRDSHPMRYGGWWGLCFPVVALKRCGLPLPLFIRSDDMEFGVRLLSHAQCPTLGWPGIGVWHKTFAGETREWLAYYTVRNNLIVHAVHDLQSGNKVFSDVFRALTQAYKIRSYTQIRLNITAILDVLNGPACLDSDKVDERNKWLYAGGKWKGANPELLPWKPLYKQIPLRFQHLRYAMLIFLCMCLFRLSWKRKSKRWEKAFDRLTSNEFWHDYLGLKP